MEDKLITPAGRDYVSPFPPTSKLPLVQPVPIVAQPVIGFKPPVTLPPAIIKAPEPVAPPVFNRSGQIQGFSLPGQDYIQIEPGKWTQETSAKKPIPRSFALQHLRNNEQFNVQIPSERFFANDEKHLTVAACIDNVVGWGICNSHIIEQLALLRGESVETEGGWSVDAAEPVSKSDLLLYPTTYWQYAGVPEITQRLMRRAYHPTKWGLAMTIPTEIGYIPVKNLILMSMWEGQVLPTGWGEPLRKYVKHLIVPSETQKEAFAKEFNGEISVVPLGVDTDTFAYQERPQRGEDEPFTILVYGSPLTSRKSPLETIYDVCYLAFGEAFGEPIDNWKIILKTRQGILGGGKFTMTTDSFADPHIEVISGYYTTQELAELCYRADVGIALSKHEGAGMIPAEQMSTGLPVILSNHSGLTELCDPMFNIPIDPIGQTTPEDIGYANESGLYWYLPDYQKAARELRWQYQLWQMGGRRQSEMGRRAAEYIRRNRTWQQTAQGIQNVLEKVIGAEAN